MMRSWRLVWSKILKIKTSYTIKALPTHQDLPPDPQKMSILYACVAFGTTILNEHSIDPSKKFSKGTYHFSIISRWWFSFTSSLMLFIKVCLAHHLTLIPRHSSYLYHLIQDPTKRFSIDICCWELPLVSACGRVCVLKVFSLSLSSSKSWLMGFFFVGNLRLVIISRRMMWSLCACLKKL